METEICGCDLIAAGGRRHGMNLKEQHELHAAIICCEHKAAPAGSSRKLARGNRVNISSSKPPGDRRMAAADRIEPPPRFHQNPEPHDGQRGGAPSVGVGGWGVGGTGQDKRASPAKIGPGIFIRAAAITQLMIDGQEIIWQPF